MITPPVGVDFANRVRNNAARRQLGDTCPFSVTPVLSENVIQKSIWTISGSNSLFLRSNSLFLRKNSLFR